MRKRCLLPSNKEREGVRMICNNCKQSYDDSLNACPYCGAVKMPTAESAAPQQSPQPQQNQQAYTAYQQQPYGQVPQVQTAPPAKGSATTSLVCGIIAIVLGCLVPIAGIILGIIAVVTGNKAKRILPPEQRGSANAGFICGIIGIVVAVIFWIINAIIISSLTSFLYY